MWTRYGVAAFLVVFTLGFGFLMSHFGYTVDGVPVQQVGGWEDLTSWFMNMLAFKVDNMPDVFSIILWLVPVLVIVLVWSAIRGE